MSISATRAPGFTRSADRDDAESRWYLGQVMTYLLTSAESAGGPCVIEATVPAGSGPPEHVHAHEDEMVFVLAGSATFYLEGEARKVGAGSFVWLPRGHRHTFAFDEQSRVLCVVTPGAAVEGVFRESSVPAECHDLPPADAPMEDVQLVVKRFVETGCSITGPPPGGAATDDAAV